MEPIAPQYEVKRLKLRSLATEASDGLVIEAGWEPFAVAESCLWLRRVLPLNVADSVKT